MSAATETDLAQARRLELKPMLTRLAACLAGGVVLALMWGEQEGTQEDYGYAFHQAVFDKRILVFLGIGVVAFLGITFWPRVRPFLTKPGMPSFLAGVATVIASYVLLHWYDAITGQKLSDLADAVDKTSSGLSPFTEAFFGWLHWTAVLVALAVGVFAIGTQQRIIAWVVAAFSVVMAVIVVLAKQDVLDLTGARDHSLGSIVAVAGWLVMAVALAAAALTKQQVASTREAVDRFLNIIPGLPLIVAGFVLVLLSFFVPDWFSPTNLNTGFSDMYDLFNGSGASGLSLAYLQWLGWVLVIVSAVAGGVGAYLRRAVLGWIGAIGAVVTIFITLYVLYDTSDVAAKLGQDSADGPWQNLGVGGWITCIGLTLIAGGAGVVAWVHGSLQGRQRTTADGVPAAPKDKMSPSTRNLILLGVAVALFFPPTMTEFWQKVLVSEIGVYVLLAVGLNVVVGWAGLLDLGFIAFYAIGSYTTAFLVGSLPRKPPEWLHLSPLWAIPFAIVICLLAGLALGAPTLRLRGDYLAIVTLGFGEIIRITAVNNPGQITNSTRGTQPAVPHPVIDLGFIRFEWSLNNLQYWYLLLVILAVVVVLFYRLEGSRLGRAWAAIREDEVAAQATGINTIRVKLLAFAIGASTSGVAGVFFASQIGYFNPDNFKLENSILVVAYVVFGGMGSLPGAMAGAAVLTWLPEFLKDQVPADDRQMWIGAVVLLMMIFRPAGLLPARRRKAELEGLEGTDSSEVRAVPASEGV